MSTGCPGQGGGQWRGGQWNKEILSPGGSSGGGGGGLAVRGGGGRCRGLASLNFPCVECSCRLLASFPVK